MKPRLAAFLLLAMALAGCPAVYPEIGTRTRAIPAGQPLDPAPPSELRWMRFVSARVPERTRDGRPWGPSGKPSPYAKLLLNGAELFRTPVQSNTFEPTWPDGPRGNFKIGPSDKLRIELWDNAAINDKPIGVRDFGSPTEQNELDKQIRVLFDDGGEVVLAYEPAHAVSGLGLWFELHTDACFITRLLQGSPAERAGLLAGDEVLKIGTREVKAMTPDEVKSAFNAVPFDGLALTVKHSAGSVADLTIKEGPIYPTFAQFGRVD
ncbi:MAG: PDZ domain-containing protein [Minicystis sp.]